MNKIAVIRKFARTVDSLEKQADKASGWYILKYVEESAKQGFTQLVRMIDESRQYYSEDGFNNFVAELKKYGFFEADSHALHLALCEINSHNDTFIRIKSQVDAIQDLRIKENEIMDEPPSDKKDAKLKENEKALDSAREYIKEKVIKNAEWLDYHVENIGLNDPTIKAICSVMRWPGNTRPFNIASLYNQDGK